MRSLTILAIGIYQSLEETYPHPIEREQATRQHILNEITEWPIRVMTVGQDWVFTPVGFSGDETSSPFQIRLSVKKVGGHELKFGNLNADSDLERYEWDDEDPNRLRKALFLKRVLETKVIPMLETGVIDGIVFQPYDGDGLGDDRFSYFYNMYSKLGKTKYNMIKQSNGTYMITPKR